MDPLRYLQQFDCEDEDVGTRFNTYVGQLQRAFRIRRVTDDSEKQDIMCVAAGEKLTAIHESLHEEGDSFEQTVAKIQAHFNPTISARGNTLKFRTTNQNESESFEEFVTRLRERAARCNFGERLEAELCEQLISGCKDQKLKEDGLARPDMSLAEAIQIGRNRQLIATQLAEMNETNSSARELNQVASSHGRVQDTRVEQQREVDRGQERGERELNQVAGGHGRTQGARVEQERGYERG
jgi:hypothetical protein